MPKQPWRAVFLTSLLPGAGHIYGGEAAKGVFLISLTLIFCFTFVFGMIGFISEEDAAASRGLMLITVASATIGLLIEVYALFNAFKVTTDFNARQGPAPENADQRKSWLAAFLSLLFPGVGQFYNRQVLKGIALVVLAVAASIAEHAYYELFFLSSVVFFLSIKDAFDSTEKYKGSSERFLKQGKYFILFVLVILFLPSLFHSDELISGKRLKTYKFPSGSMMPTLRIGDRIFVDRSQKARESVKRGDVIIFPFPEDPGKMFAKRLIGVGGDKVQFINGELYINDQMVSKTVIGASDDDGLRLVTKLQPVIYEEQFDGIRYHVMYLRDQSAYNAGPWFVPQDMVFVLGDSRDNSQDSRVWGFVPKKTIEGKVLKIYWSWDSEHGRVNWDRIGQMTLMRF